MNVFEYNALATPDAVTLAFASLAASQPPQQVGASPALHDNYSVRGAERTNLNH
jgi:hypothetical protein